MDEQRIFEGALEKESAEARAAWIAMACGDDPLLKARVEALLESRSRASGAQKKPPVECEATIVSEASRSPRPRAGESKPATAYRQGETIVMGSASVLKSLDDVVTAPRVALRELPADSGLSIHSKSTEIPGHDSDYRYQLHGEIARGGMGAILKGRDTDLGRELAIKVLLDQHKDNPQIVERFIEEAQIGGQLQHPGITPVYELGRFEDQRPYFSMKLVKGETLAKLLADRADPAADRGKLLNIFEQVCQTMAYAHSRGVIHRDLKPTNVMVGAFGEVQVMDWGLAKVLPGEGVVSEQKTPERQPGHSVVQTLRSKVGSDVSGTLGSIGSHTQMGSVMGTPAYMPPEQALGEIDHLDERADVFGLGAILCEILTGLPPYVAEDSTQVFRLASRGKLADCFQRLDACGTDTDLIVLTKQCLAPEPKDRPRDAGVLAARVSHYLESVEAKLHASETEAAVQTERLEQQQRSSRKLQKMIGGLAVVSLLAIGTSLVAGKFWNDAEISRQAAKQEAERANEQEKTALRERDAARQAQLAALDQTYLATRSEIRALRFSRQAGWRSAAFDRLRSLVKLGSRNLDLIDLRTEALACISTMDVQEHSSLPGDFSGWHMAYGPDARTIAVEAEDQIVLLDLQSNKAFGAIPAKKLGPFAFHNSGTLAVADGTGRVKYHVIQSGQQAPPDLVGEGAAMAIAFNRASDRVAVIWGETENGARLLQAQVYSTATGESLWKQDLPPNIDFTYKSVVALSPDGTKLATHGPQFEVHLYTVGSEQPPVVLGKLDNRLCAISFHPSEPLVIAAGIVSGVAWDYSTHVERFRIHSPVGGLWEVAFSPSGQLIGAISDDGIARFWDGLSGRELLDAATKAPRSSLSLAFSPTEDRIAFCGGTVGIFDITGHRECRHDYTATNNVSVLAFDWRNAALLISGNDGRNRTWKLAEPLARQPRYMGHVRPTALRVAPDGQHVAQGFGSWPGDESPNYAVKAWPSNDPSKVQELVGPQGEVHDLAFDPVGRMLAAAAQDGGLYLWNFETGQLQRRLALHPNRLQFLDENKIVVVTENRLLVVSIEDGAILRETPLSAPGVALAITPDKQAALVATGDNRVRRVQLSTLAVERQTRTNLDLASNVMSLSPDGRLLIVATKSGERTLFIDPVTLEPLAHLPFGERRLHDMKFSPSGQYLVLGGNQTTLWDLDLAGAELAELGLAFGGFNIAQSGPWLLDAVKRTSSRAEKARLIASAATVPGMLDTLSEQAENDSQLHAELAAYFAQQNQTQKAEHHRAQLRRVLQEELQQHPRDTVIAKNLLEVLLPPLQTNALVATSEKSGVAWRRTTTAPESHWPELDYADDSWQVGQGPFVSDGNAERGSDWNSPDIWLRHSFELKNLEPQQKMALLLRICCDDIADVYLNGQVVARLPTYTRGQYVQIDLPPETYQKLRSGKNLLAVHAKNHHSVAVIDVGLLSVTSESGADPRQQLAAHRIQDTWAQLAATYHLADNQAALQELQQWNPAAVAGLADLHMAVNDWPQAINAYTKALAATPDDLTLLIKRAQAYDQNSQPDLAGAAWKEVFKQRPALVSDVYTALVNQSRWQEAAQYALLRAEQRPKEALAWLEVAPVIVLGDDQEAYKDFCQRATQQFMSYENEEQAERILKSCLLRPGSVDFLKPAADYLNSLLDEGKTRAGFGPWGWATRALWSYRSGDAAATVKAVQASEAAQPTEMVHVLNLVLLALAEHELQHPEAARRAFYDATPIIERLKENKSHDSLIPQLLYREAQTLLGSQGK